MRTDVSVAANAQLAPVVEYSVTGDRGWRQFAALSGAHARDLNAQRAVIETHPDHHGWTRPLQALRGLAPLALGAGRPAAGPSSEIGDERSSGLDNPALRIFAERLKRGGYQL